MLEFVAVRRFMPTLIDLTVRVVVEVIGRVLRERNIREHGLRSAVSGAISREPGKVERHGDRCVEKTHPRMSGSDPCLGNPVKRVVGVVIEIQYAAKSVSNRQDVAVRSVINS